MERWENLDPSIPRSYAETGNSHRSWSSSIGSDLHDLQHRPWDHRRGLCSSSFLEGEIKPTFGNPIFSDPLACLWWPSSSFFFRIIRIWTWAPLGRPWPSWQSWSSPIRDVLELWPWRTSIMCSSFFDLHFDDISTTRGDYLVKKMWSSFLLFFIFDRLIILWRANQTKISLTIPSSFLMNPGV